MSFGSVSNHVHKIAGASSITINSTYDSLRESECTSCTIQADKSAYWTPGLYFHHANGSYEEVPNTGMAVYYLGRGSDPWGNLTANPFPPGLKMLSGNNTARTQDLTTMTWGNATYPPRLVSEAITMVCINYTPGLGSQTYNMTNMDCPDGFRAQVQMQTCWDGKNLFLEDQSHMAHLSQIDNGVCPPSHPVLLPHLFYEMYYSVNNFLGMDGSFVFDNGDETGYGFHGDFINGWDIPTLTEAIDQCLIGNVDGVVEECPVFDATNNPNSASTCPQQSPIFPCEKVGPVINKLPGCITPTGYGQVVTAADITCPGGNTVACNASDPLPPLPWAGDSKYSPIGCYTEATSGRALSADSYVSTTNMTATTCEAFCYGYKYFGVEWSQECYCGDTINSGSVPANASQCNMDCSGDEWEICGGSDRLNMYQMNATLYKPPPVPTTYPGDSYSEYIGCYTEATNQRALSSKSYSSTTNMTAQNCEAFCGTSYTYFGVEWSQQCFCGNELNPGSVLVNSSQCDYLCTGNKLQYCGGSSRLNVYKRINDTASHTTTASATASHATTAGPTSFSNASSSAISSSVAYTNTSASLASASATSSANSASSSYSAEYPEPRSIGNTGIGVWDYQGCYTEATSGRALDKAFLYGTVSTVNMTLETCALYCFDDNYSLFGVEYSQQCYCGNNLTAGAVLASDQNDCSMPCAGNATQYCGGSSRLNLYALVPGSGYDPVTHFSTLYPEPLRVGNASVGVWNYTGCYTEATSGRALASTFQYGSPSTFNMTIEACVAFCNGGGYSLAGVEYGQQCFCGNELAAGSVWAPSQNDCSMSCAGNSSEYCGAGDRLNVYSLLSSATRPLYTNTTTRA